MIKTNWGPEQSHNFSRFQFSLRSCTTGCSSGDWFGAPRTQGGFCSYPFSEQRHQFGQSPQYMNWIFGIKWSRSLWSDCSSLTTGSKGKEFMLLFCYHSLGPLTPIPMQFPHLVRYNHGLVKKKQRTIRQKPFYHVYNPLQSSLSFFPFPLPHASQGQVSYF